MHTYNCNFTIPNVNFLLLIPPYIHAYLYNSTLHPNALIYRYFFCHQNFSKTLRISHTCTTCAIDRITSPADRATLSLSPGTKTFFFDRAEIRECKEGLAGSENARALDTSSAPPAASMELQSRRRLSLSLFLS